MGIREDIAQEISRQAEARGAPADRKAPAEAAPARRKFDDAQSTPEALEQQRRTLSGGGELYKGSEVGKSRLGSLASSDALLKEYSWKPGPRPPEGASRLFAKNGERWAEPNKSIGNG